MAGQQIYEAVNSFTSSIWLVDAGNCTRTEIVSNIPYAIDDFAEIPGGNFFMVHAPNSAVANFYSIDPVNGATTLLLSVTFGGGIGSSPSRMLLVSPTEILWAVRGRFYIFNLTNNTLTLLATYPSTPFVWNLYILNGQIYYSEQNPSINFSEDMYTISLTPTFSRTYIGTIPSSSVELGNIRDVAEACDQLYSGGNMQLINYNLDNFTTSIHCSWSNSTNISAILPVAPLLSGTTGPTCGCITDAGTWNNFNPTIVEACAGGIINLPHNGDEVLTSGQNLSFALYSLSFGAGQHFYENLTSSSLVHIYPSPQLNFLPGITAVNEIYYVIPIASDAPPGSFNLDDPCRDLQEGRLVRWLTPTVSFTEINPVTCGNGCRTIQATFEGSPPFTLTYSADPSSGGAPQTFTQTFTSNSGTFQVCPPAGYTGSLAVQALSITDNSGCTCN